MSDGGSELSFDACQIFHLPKAKRASMGFVYVGAHEENKSIWREFRIELTVRVTPFPTKEPIISFLSNNTVYAGVCHAWSFRRTQRLD